MKFLDPRTDFAFKKIFGSAEAREVLVSLIESVMGLTGDKRLREVSLINPYEAPRLEGFKPTYLDVKCTDLRGITYVVEMQVQSHEAFFKRVVFNACKTYVNQLLLGDQYPKLNQVVAISILDFVAFGQLEHYVTCHTVREEVSNHLYLDEVRYYFVELPKMARSENELRNDIDRWAFFLRQAGSLEQVPESLRGAPFAKAFEIATLAKMTVEEMDAYEGSRIKLQNDRGAITLAQSRGRTEGRAEGEAKGRAEGRAQERAEAILTILAAREVGVPEAVREAILSCTDPETLGRWLRCAATAGSAEEVIGEP